ITLVDVTGNLLDTLLSTHYYMIFGGIGLVKPLKIVTQSLTEISNINYSASSQTISCTINNTAATIGSVSTPLKVDVSAPQRWWNYKARTNDYWFSIYGFHANGVD